MKRGAYYKKGDREQPGNYSGITLLSAVSKVFCEILNNRMVQHLDKGGYCMKDRPVSEWVV